MFWKLSCVFDRVLYIGILDTFVVWTCSIPFSRVIQNISGAADVLDSSLLGWGLLPGVGQR